LKGSPGFIGERLRQAREARGLTAISLSELLGISRQAISLYETGNVTPQPDILFQIADKLHLPISFFLTEIQKTNDKPVFFRSLSAAAKLDRGRGNVKLDWLMSLILPYLRLMVSFPEVNIPPNVFQDITTISQRKIEEVAANTRKYWGLGKGPISNIVLLLENNGVIIVRSNLSSPALDAFSTWNMVDNTPYIILGSDKGSPTRSRFDAAHELGHLILHRNIEKSKLNNTHFFKLIEQQANYFASAFLVPPEALADDYTVPTLDALLLLKERWRVSVGMLIMTIANLGFVNEEHEKRLWINYNRRGWKKSEPREDKIPMENPVLLERACRLIIKENVKTAQNILNEIPLAEADIEELMNLEDGFLKPSQPVLSLRYVHPTSPDDYKDALDEVENILHNPGG